MATIERFEDSTAWKLARQVTREVRSASKRGEFARDYGLRDQIGRAAVSIMSNIAEGFERGSNKDFVRFLYMARGSAGEVRSQLYVALDEGYLTEAEFDALSQLTMRCSQTIGGWIRYLEGATTPQVPTIRELPPEYVTAVTFNVER